MTGTARQRWRNFRILSADDDSCLIQALTLLGEQQALWVSDSPPKNTRAISPSKVAEYLGQDIEHLVFDARQALNPDALAIAAGLVRGGGYFLLLTPELSRWGQQPHSLFLQRMARLCQTHSPPPSDPVPCNPDAALTTGQEQVIEALRRVARGHRNRPLVVIADRGRGKSSAFGIGAARLLAEGLDQILVTAPRRNAVDTLFREAARELDITGQPQEKTQPSETRIRFIPPDELLQQLPATSLLLVDEAAGIPLPMLEKILTHYRRVAFATTVHGYEGSGRGFSLRFGKTLDEYCPQWKRLTLSEPVRWAAGDPLEAFIFEALLLDAEPARVTRQESLSDLEIRPLARESLARNPTLLQQLFGLLVDAHYRTTPTDLKHLLDAPDLSIHCARLNGDVVAALLVATEGALPESLHREVICAQRRPRGQLLPTILASHCGFPQGLSLNWERILRIAVHPALQGQGIGSRMLDYLASGARDRNVDLLGSSFGATPALLDFWRRGGYVPVRLGQRREASSGAHAVTMLRGISPAGEALQSQAQAAFQELFPVQLAEPFRQLPHALIQRLLTQQPRSLLRHRDREILQAFAAGQRQYLDALGALRRLARCETSNALLTIKVLQGRNWRESTQASGLSGKKAALRALRASVAAWLKNHPDEQSAADISECPKSG